QALGETFGQSFVVENKVGGNGTVAAEFVAGASADGYTLFMVAQPVFAIVPAMIKAPYDPVADFTPISIVGTNQFALGVHKSVPANTLADLIAYVKSKPSGSLNYSSGSIASVSHLVMELLLVRAGIKVEHVPFKGGSLSLQSLVSGQTPMGFNNVSEVIPFAKSGEIRLLAVSGNRRATQLPEVPTVAESGFPGFNAQTWNGLVGPAKLPREIVDRAAAEVRRRVKEPVFAQRMGGLGVDLLGTTPEEFAATIRADIPLWAEAIRVSGAKVE
ncbi:MAG: tripartite tricarboxylate transporter substrate binding protein, partial [Sulfuricaulis sp.]|nr:tripartite tricarboxylate transporter substrate binding protein [Sulfuricaulis sp.]